MPQSLADFQDSHYSPDPITKELYIKQFGREAYAKNIGQQFVDKSLPCPVPIPCLSKLWERGKLYATLMQLMFGMSILTWQNKGKAVHGDPAILAFGEFQLDKKARKKLGFSKRTPSSMPIRLRHNFSNVRGTGHPLAKMVKSASVAIGDWFHLTCLSSNISGFWNLTTFMTFIEAQVARAQEDVNRSLELVKNAPLTWELYKALPYDCESYMDLIYHSLIVFDFEHPKDKSKHLMRFRIKPRGAIEDAKLMPKEEINRMYMSDWYSYDDRDKDKDVYEKDYARRLDSSPDKKLWYDIEYQIRPLPTEYRDVWFARNCSIPWSEEDFQFHSLGIFWVNTIKPDEYNAFQLTTLFPGLSYAEPESAHDTASIAWSRVRVYNCTQQIRSACCMR